MPRPEKYDTLDTRFSSIVAEMAAALRKNANEVTQRRVESTTGKADEDKDVDTYDTILIVESLTSKRSREVVIDSDALTEYMPMMRGSKQISGQRRPATNIKADTVSGPALILPAPCTHCHRRCGATWAVIEW